MERERLTLPLHRYRQVAIVTLAGLCLLVVAGGIVRLTGSGLGCDDWPACNKARFVDVSSGHTAIEQINRLLSGLVGVPTLMLIVGAFIVRPRRRGLVGPSIGVLLSVFGNAVLGGIAVRGQLHPALVQAHFILAIISITFAMVAVHRSGPTEVATNDLPVSGTARFVAVGAMTALALATGTIVTGTGPHAGDELARRWGFDITRVAQIHSVAVWLAVVAMLVLVVWLRHDRALYERHTARISTWMFLAVVQGGIGYLQYFNGVPEVLVGVHLAGATALWVSTVHFVQTAVTPFGVPDTAADAIDSTNTGEMSLSPSPRV